MKTNFISLLAKDSEVNNFYIVSCVAIQSIECKQVFWYRLVINPICQSVCVSVSVGQLVCPEGVLWQNG